ncbi:hypothetical protein [Butyricimonas virosa]|nr:hypothetical protein [Butyricimonas virosa]
MAKFKGLTVVEASMDMPGTAISPYLNATGSALSKSMVIRWS